MDKNMIFLLRCQMMTYTSLQNMQIHNTELHCSIYHNTTSRHTSKNILKTIRQNPRHKKKKKHCNYSSVPFRARDFDLYLSRKGSRAERKHQFTSPLHLHRISGVLALQATGTVMRTGKAAHKLGRSAVHSQYGFSVI
jgi:hypothetical protein